KIMRPDIAKEYAKDIRFLYFIAKILEKRYPKLKPVSMIDIFHASMKRELDFRLEASAYSEMRDNFINDDSVYIPEVHWAATTQKVLVTSWVDGVSIYNRKEVLKLGIDPISLSEKVAVMFFNQSYRDGFFHADLHPGNIFVTKDARIALIDFGITGRLREEDRFAVAEIVFGIIKRDYIFVAKTYKHAGYISKNTDIYLFAERTRAICEPIAGLALKDISLAKILEQLFNFTEEFDMTAQPQLILLQKSMVILEGIGLSLNSDINMWKLAEPWIKKWAVKNISPEAKLIRLVKNWIEERF
ncbi:MAG: AarF/UbiB family protein, partial [Pseudomonadota bacterium]